MLRFIASIAESGLSLLERAGRFIAGRDLMERVSKSGEFCTAFREIKVSELLLVLVARKIYGKKERLTGWDTSLYIHARHLSPSTRPGDLIALRRRLGSFGGGGSSAASLGGVVVDDDTNTGTTFASAELDEGALGQSGLGECEGSVEACKVSFGFGCFLFRSLTRFELLAHALD